MKDELAVFAAILGTAGIVPYIIDVIRKKTKPNIVTWFTWSLLTGIGTAAAFAAHEPHAALLTLASTICCIAVVLAGLRYGVAKLSLFDGCCQAAAVVGLALWLVFDSPTIGVVIPVATDCVALLPTLRHAWLRPNEETWQTFLVASIASGLTLVSLSRLTIAGTLYPTYLMVSDILIVGAILYQRKQKSVHA